MRGWNRALRPSGLPPGPTRAQSPPPALAITEGSGLHTPLRPGMRTTARCGDRNPAPTTLHPPGGQIGQGDFITSALSTHGHWSTPAIWHRSPPPPLAPQAASRQGRRTDHATAIEQGQGRRLNGTNTARSVSNAAPPRAHYPPGGPGATGMLWQVRPSEPVASLSGQALVLWRGARLVWLFSPGISARLRAWESGSRHARRASEPAKHQGKPFKPRATRGASAAWLSFIGPQAWLGREGEIGCRRASNTEVRAGRPRLGKEIFHGRIPKHADGLQPCTHRAQGGAEASAAAPAASHPHRVPVRANVHRDPRGDPRGQGWTALKGARVEGQASRGTLSPPARRPAVLCTCRTRTSLTRRTCSQQGQ